MAIRHYTLSVSKETYLTDKRDLRIYGNTPLYAHVQVDYGIVLEAPLGSWPSIGGECYNDNIRPYVSRRM